MWHLETGEGIFRNKHFISTDTSFLQKILRNYVFLISWTLIHEDLPWLCQTACLCKLQSQVRVVFCNNTDGMYEDLLSHATFFSDSAHIIMVVKILKMELFHHFYVWTQPFHTTDWLDLAGILMIIMAAKHQHDKCCSKLGWGENEIWGVSERCVCGCIWWNHK